MVEEPQLDTDPHEVVEQLARDIFAVFTAAEARPGQHVRSPGSRSWPDACGH